MEKPIILTASVPGPTVVIVAGVHGNERCGLSVLEQIKSLPIKRGKLILLYGNPRAIKGNVRYTEQNLNRMFLKEEDIPIEWKTSYEYKRSRELVTCLDDADFVLDLHASATPGSEPFVICEQNALSLVQEFSPQLICLGFSVIEPGGIDGYVNRHGKVGICLECGYLGDAATDDVAYQNTIQFLYKIGLYEHADSIKSPKTILEAYTLYATQSDSFALTRQFADFELLSPNQIIGYDGNNTVSSAQSARILFARNRTKKGSEGFILLKPFLTN